MRWSLAVVVKTAARDIIPSRYAWFYDMKEEKTPKVDFKVLDAAVKKVLAYKPKRKAKADTSEKKGV